MKILKLINKSSLTNLCQFLYWALTNKVLCATHELSLCTMCTTNLYGVTCTVMVTVRNENYIGPYVNKGNSWQLLHTRFIQYYWQYYSYICMCSLNISFACINNTTILCALSTVGECSHTKRWLVVVNAQNTPSTAKPNITSFTLWYGYFLPKLHHPD